MMNSERDSINALDTRIHQLEQDAEMARQRIQKLTTQLEAETRGLRLHEDAIAELQTTRNALGQSIERIEQETDTERNLANDIPYIMGKRVFGKFYAYKAPFFSSSSSWRCLSGLA